MTETQRYKHLTTRYCVGNGVDIGSQGDPVVPWAIQLEQPAEKFKVYCGGMELPETINWQGEARDLPFKEGVLDWIYCSHVIEDWDQKTWPKIFGDWAKCLKRGGYLILLVPEFVRWNDAIKRGQTPNCSHWAPEPSGGDLSKAALRAGLVVVEERMTDLDPEDYSILGVFRKP